MPLDGWTGLRDAQRAGHPSQDLRAATGAATEATPPRPDLFHDVTLAQSVPAQAACGGNVSLTRRPRALPHRCVAQVDLEDHQRDLDLMLSQVKR